MSRARAIPVDRVTPRACRSSANVVRRNSDTRSVGKWSAQQPKEGAAEAAQPARLQHTLAAVDVYAHNADHGVVLFGRVDDPAERETDAIAGAVLRGIKLARPSVHATAGNAVQRKAAAGGTCPDESEFPTRDEERDEPMLVQPKMTAGSAGTALSPAFTASLSAAQNGGAPLPNALRTTFENRVGTRLGPVQLHTDAAAGHLAESGRVSDHGM